MFTKYLAINYHRTNSLRFIRMQGPPFAFEFLKVYVRVGRW